jgi:epidermal growth factor receptor substrate 15
VTVFGSQIWEFANQSQTGFLSRQEFFNALKLVTVAQTGRELTPELVKAALIGPAAAQIPPPRIAPPPPSSNFEGTDTPPQISQLSPLQANYGRHFSPQSGTTPDSGLQSSAYPASRRSSSYEGSVAKRHHLQAGRVSSVGSVSLDGATWSSLTTSSVPSEVQLPRSVDSCPQQLSTAGLSTANAFQNALDSASKAQRAANAQNFQGGMGRAHSEIISINTSMQWSVPVAVRQAGRASFLENKMVIGLLLVGNSFVCTMA